MPFRRALLAVLLASGALGASAAMQRTAPANALTPRAVSAANAFLVTLDEAQRRKAHLAFNEQTRTVWSNLPSGMAMQVGARERNGLKLGDMTPPQARAALALVASTLSVGGFTKAMAIVDADQVLETRSAPVRASTFSPAQRGMLLGLVREWVGILNEEAAAARMTEIEAGIADTYFAWAGPTTNGKGAYFRIQGPAVLIEYAPQGASEANIDHIHTIYREPANDYAARAARR